jgi:uncharacterized membrane protein YphA (DoxX/SURF4 family)
VYPATGPFPKGDAVVRSPAAFAHPEERHPPRPARPAFDAAALLAGRALFGGYFLYNGINHFMNRKMLVDYARSKGVSCPQVAVAASGLMILAGGASLLAGLQPKVGAGLITTFLAGVSPKMHAFWKDDNPQERMSDIVNFTKNMALIGGALLAAGSSESWRWHRGVAPERALVPSPA